MKQRAEQVRKSKGSALHAFTAASSAHHMTTTQPSFLHRMDWISELPDCLLSDILSMLSLRDLLKTSILSKRWLKLWALRRDLNFDMHNMLGSEEEMLEDGYLCHERFTYGHNYYKILKIGLCTRKFVRRVRKFVKNFQGTKIDSFKVAFHLNCEQSSAIDRWISFAIARGVGRIDLLLSGQPYVYKHVPELKRYKFSFDLFSKCDTSTLKYMHLQNCLLWHPVDFNFVPLSNLRSLVLENTYVGETLITSLLSKCPQLELLSLMYCLFTSSILDIVSSSLRHLKVVGCSVKTNSGDVHLRILDCVKLTSLEFYLGPFSINAPLLKTVYCPQLEILNLNTGFGIQVVKTSLRSTGLFKTLKQLHLLAFCDDLEEDGFDILWILSILNASPHLQNLSLTVIEPNLFADQKESKDLGIFSHCELKVVELRGCVGNCYEIELAMNLLKYVHSLEQIVLSPYWSWRYSDLSDWSYNPAWFQNGRERVREKLQGHAAGRAQLILI